MLALVSLNPNRSQWTKSRYFRMNLCIIVKASSTRALVNVVLPSISGDDFEAFLRRTAEEIIDVAVREVTSEVDRMVFEEETSDVTM